MCVCARDVVDRRRSLKTIMVRLWNGGTVKWVADRYADRVIHVILTSRKLAGGWTKRFAVMQSAHKVSNPFCGARVGNVAKNGTDDEKTVI